MEPPYKITIPKPCHEDWNAMSPEATGRFCNSCVKSVVDFTNMKAPEIQEYFTQHQGQNICGRFKNDQIHTFDIQIPQSVFRQQLSFRKAFLLTLFVVMGTTLFSCKNHDDATLGEIQVVKDTVETRHTMGILLPKRDTTDNVKPLMGKIDKERYDSLVKAGVKMPPLPPAPPPPPVKQVKSVTPVKSGTKTTKANPHIYITGDVAVTPNNRVLAPAVKKEVYSTNEVDRTPSFPGGLPKFYKFFITHFERVDENKDITTMIYCSFVVNTDGTLSDIKLLRGGNPSLFKETERVIKLSPLWIPGELNGEKVKTSFILPIKITAQ